MINHTSLLGQSCRPTQTGLGQDDIDAYLAILPGWTQDDQKIARNFTFKNYYETLAFVNAIAYVIHAQDHHPELIVTYNKCNVRFDTHTVNGGKGGLSINDFICAAKVDAIFTQAHDGAGH